MISRLFARSETIIAAWKAALAGRDPAVVDILDLLPAIYAAVPNVSDDEIVDALSWSARQDEREARALEGFRERR
jgi:hypothetical protein